jgi:LysR family hydrogen peroxide-inducible transcriptional activator
MIPFSLTQIEYVLSVAQHRHFGKAAQACHIGQPTLSMQVQKLEEDLDVVLFDRSKKPILLTPIGEKLIPQMQILIFESKKIQEMIKNNKSEKLKGELRLGIIPTITPYLLPRLMSSMSMHFPDIRLIISELQTDRMIRALEDDDLDVGLLSTPLGLPRIHELPLFYEPFYLLCRKDHELSRKKKVNHHDLTREDIWLLEEGHCLRHQVLDICSIKKNQKNHRQFRFEGGSLETLKNLVETNGGVTLVPKLSLDKISSNTLVKEFDRPIPAREVGLVYRREHYKLELIEALGEAVLLSIPQDLRKLRTKDLDVLPVL